jgi:F0F1-type ATP synthase membrane subunit a
MKLVMERKFLFLFFRAGNADLNTTLALAVIAVFMIQFLDIGNWFWENMEKIQYFSGPIDFVVVY